MTTTLIIAPIYYIISGVESGQGVVVSRTRKGNENIYPLDIANGRWFVV